MKTYIIISRLCCVIRSTYITHRHYKSLRWFINPLGHRTVFESHPFGFLFFLINALCPRIVVFTIRPTALCIYIHCDGCIVIAGYTRARVKQCTRRGPRRLYIYILYNITLHSVRCRRGTLREYMI